MRFFRHVLALQFMFAAIGSTARAASVIEWELDNPFRFFKYAEDTKKHRDAYAAIDKKEGSTKTPILEIERHLSRETGGHGWAEAIYTRVHMEPCWEKSGVECRDYVLPKTHAVKFRAPGQSGTCIWSVDKGADATNPVGGRTNPCDAWTVLDIPYEGNSKTGGASVTVTVGGAVVATEFIHVDDILVAGLGDSFASGEGNPDKAAAYHSLYDRYDPVLDRSDETSGYPKPQVNAIWLDAKCHRSLYSHQLRTALQLAITDPGTGRPAAHPKRSVTYIGLGCTGAEIVEGLFQRLHDHRGQLSALISALCNRLPVEPKKGKEKKIYRLQTAEGMVEEGLYDCPTEDRLRDLDVLLMSIGGNDVEFSRIIEGVAVAKVKRNTFDALSDIIEAFSGKEAQFKPRYPDDKDFGKNINKLSANYAQLAEAITTGVGLKKDTGKLFLTAYPFIAYANTDEICPYTTRGMNVSPFYAIDRNRALAAECAIHGGSCVAEVLGPKVSVVGLTEKQRSAAKDNWIFVDSIRADDAFKAHGLCAYSSEELENNALGNAAFPRRSSHSFHPKDYRHYASRTRWFRSPNDAYLGARSKDWVFTGLPEEKFALWVAYFGAFHPTAEGQAYMADMVFKDVTTWLNKAK